MTLLSKRDFEALGCEDVSGAQLRARVFRLEGLVAEMALTLEEIDRDLDCQGYVRAQVRDRVIEVLESAREAMPASPTDPQRRPTPA